MDITVTMNEAEIVEAIKGYMSEKGVLTVGKDTEVNLVAGRGTNGHSAVISIKQEDMLAVTKVLSTTEPEPIKPEPKKKKEVTPATNPIPEATLFDEPTAKEDALDANSMGEGEPADVLFDEPIAATQQAAEVDSLFN